MTLLMVKAYLCSVIVMCECYERKIDYLDGNNVIAMPSTSTASATSESTWSFNFKRCKNLKCQ